MLKAITTFWHRYRKRTIAVAVLLTVYVGSYAMLYRRGTAEANPMRLSGFFYVPIAEIQQVGGLTRRHQTLMFLYAPLNIAHQQILGGQSPVVCLLRMS